MPHSTQPLEAVLTACAAELEELSARCEALQAALSETVSRGGGDAQALDLITQRTAGLADFLENVAGVIPAEWQVDADAAARKLTLTDLASALTGRARLAADPGELDFFGA
ncbi:hypothetical protein [Phenylobacterium sp.]|jgi:hypothetical protein|uniref:hypothetical protein n=1 Tax=Phenylobacterium sp. TaxID=1871053 RepID=UPI002F95DC2D